MPSLSAYPEFGLALFICCFPCLVYYTENVS